MARLNHVRADEGFKALCQSEHLEIECRRDGPELVERGRLNLAQDCVP